VLHGDDPEGMIRKGCAAVVPRDEREGLMELEWNPLARGRFGWLAEFPANPERWFQSVALEKSGQGPTQSDIDGGFAVGIN
jgi:hypothetical protein